MSLNLNDLRLFVEIVEHRGILRAARALGLPKSTLSRRLAGLEEHLRTRLILRSGEGVTLTAAGREVLALCRPMVEAARTAEDRLAANRQSVSGEVAISISPALMPAALPALAALIGNHPDLRVHTDSSDRPVEPVGDGPDLYLRLHVGSLRDTSLIQRRVCRTPQMLVAASTADRDIGLADIDRMGLLAFDDGSGLPETTLSGPDRAMFQPARPPRLRSGDPALLIAAALAGQGVLLVPQSIVLAEVAAGRLAHVLPSWTGVPATATLLSPPRHAMNAALRTTADSVAQAVKAAVLGVPHPGPGIPELRPLPVTRLSHSPCSPKLQPTGGTDSPDPGPTTGGDPTLTPIRNALGSAALAATAGLAMPAFAQDAAGPLVLYTNDFEGVITARFEADTGREIDVVQMSGGELLARIAAEASNPQWDVLIFNGSYTFEMLDREGMLMRGVEPANIGNLNTLGQQYLAANGSWFPIGLAASCVMLYRTDLVDEPPRDFADLADPRFEGMFGMADPAVAAPAYPCVAAFFETMGHEAAQDMFTRFFANGMRVFRTNGPLGRALSSGEVALALITSQVAYTVVADGDVPVQVVWPETGAPGVVRGTAISAGTARPEAAQAFVEWLLEPATQSFLAEAVPTDGKFEPTVAGAVRRADGPPEGVRYIVASDGFAVDNEAEIKTWFADQALN